MEHCIIIIIIIINVYRNIQKSFLYFYWVNMNVIYIYKTYF